MGQRFQSVFILPAVDMGECYNEPNPNNRSEKVLIFHNQWLYGRGAININLYIIERLKKYITSRKKNGIYARTKQDYINHFLENDLINCIKWASIKDLHGETSFCKPEVLVYSEEEKKPKESQISLSKLLRSQDNNNGFFICRIKKNLKIEYTFISGLEDTKEHEFKTPKEYLKLFYSSEDLEEEKKGLSVVMEKQIKKFNKFEPIPKEILKTIIKNI